MPPTEGTSGYIEGEFSSHTESRPEKAVTEIIDRMWSADRTEKDNLTHDEALILLVYGGDAGIEMIKAEEEAGRYTPTDDVRFSLEQRQKNRGNHPIN
jgi:hypothetical protein